MFDYLRLKNAGFCQVEIQFIEATTHADKSERGLNPSCPLSNEELKSRSNVRQIFVKSLFIAFKGSRLWLQYISIEVLMSFMPALFAFFVKFSVRSRNFILK